MALLEEIEQMKERPLRIGKTLTLPADIAEDLEYLAANGVPMEDVIKLALKKLGTGRLVKEVKQKKGSAKPSKNEEKTASGNADNATF